MLDTYIKNRGSTKTLIYDNNRNHINEINWDVDYDGEVANISLDTQKNGKQKHYDVKLDNEDLANILNVPSVRLPLEKRLKRDFKNTPNIYQIEFESSPVHHKKNEQTVEELLESIQSHQPHKSLHISSPMPNEEFIIPLTLNNKSIDKYTLTPKQNHRKKRTHKIHKVYKKHKSNKKSRRH